MRKYVKLTAAVVSATLLATLFAGCGGGKKEATTADGKTIITKWDGDTHAQKVTEMLAKDPTFKRNLEELKESITKG